MLEYLTDVFSYLDDLRESGVTNMYGAGVYIAADFLVDNKEANRLLGLWMKTFDKSRTAEERAKKALEEQNENT